MFVCLCNGIRDRELRELAGKGVRTAGEAYRRLGVEMNCADCAECIQGFIDDALNIPSAAGENSA